MIKGYEKLPSGVIKQIDPKPIVYDKQYVEERYNTYGELGMQMAYLRLGNLIGAIGYVPTSILDVGYGNGDFLKACTTLIKDCYGSDISGYPVPDKCKFVEDFTKDYYSVITFFDVLEHFEDIDFIKDLRCNHIVISAPNCHYESDEWFTNWKHRRFNEHIYHFNVTTLINFMKECGYRIVNDSYIEDSIRKPTDGKPNIFTAIFEKQTPKEK